MDGCGDVPQYMPMAIRWLAIQQTGENMMIKIETEQQNRAVARREQKLSPSFMPFFKIIILNQRKLIPWYHL